MQRRFAELDGLRGLSAVMVVTAHYVGEPPHGLRFLTLGWIAVDIFFVLSGFLVGGIILDHARESGFFRWFYLRRLARIIPAYYLIFPLVLLAIAASQGHSWSDQSWSTAVYATFSTNFVMAWHNALGSTWLGPVWTLAVEEQFYLIMPLLIVFLPRNLLPAALVGLTVSALLLRIALIGSHPLAAFALLPCRMDLLVCGVGAALLYRECDLTRHLLLLRLVPLIGLCLMLIVRLGIGNGAFLMSSNTIAGVAIAALILSLVLGAPEAAHYRNRVLCWFGKTSYCFYLVHQPVSGLLHGLLRNSTPDVGTPAAVAVTALAAAVSIALAALSWRLYEKPILSWAAERSERLRCRKLVVQPT